MTRRHVTLDLLVLAALAWSNGCGAVDALELAFEGAAGDGWSTGAVRLELAVSPAGELGLDLRAGALRLPAPLDGLESLSLRCPKAATGGGSVRCDPARAVLTPRRGDALGLAAKVEVDLATGESRVSVPEQAFAAGRLSLTLRTAKGRLSLELNARDLDMARLASVLWAPESAAVSVSAGRLTGTLRVEAAGGATRVSGNLLASAAAFSDATGLRAGEDLSLDLNADLVQRGGEWRGAARLTIPAGTLYVDPLLLDASSSALRLEVEGARVGGAGIDVARAEVSLDGVLQASGSVGLELAGALRLRQLGLQVTRTALGPVYTALIRPFLPAGPLANLSIEGDAALAVDWRAESPSALTLDLHSVNLGDGAGRFALLGLDGAIQWRDRQPMAATRLRMRTAQLGRLALGEVTLDAAFQGRNARLLTELVVPVLDGRLRVARLEASGLGTPQARMELDSELDPISMQALSERMAWLPLSGTISGRIPALVFENDALRVEGDLELDLFQGRATVSNLSVAYPFSAAPEVRTDIRLDDLSLAELSRSMSFGSIEGRLSGSVTGLVLEGLRPIAFDAYLGTPEDDDSRHRISQRAVDNLASLGGASAVLSSTFLRFFESFAYERLGLGCRLQAGVCLMRGVEEASDGYYIVKGGGLPPRVNVVGYNRRVNWDTLLERLRAVASSSGPVVR